MENEITKLNREIEQLENELKKPLTPSVKKRLLKEKKDTEWLKALTWGLALIGEETYTANSLKELKAAVKRLTENPEKENYRINEKNVKIEKIIIYEKQLKMKVNYTDTYYTKD